MSQSIRIFISSPGDVADERRRAALVIGRLRREFGNFFDLAPVLWEYEPMLSSGHFQDIIEPPSDVDIMVLILWSRLGTPLPERTAKREYRGMDGRAPVTGTEWEFEQALEAQQRRDGVPALLVYRKFTDGFARFSRADQLDQIKLQWESLQSFWERHFEGPDGFKAAFNRFTDLDEFEAQLEAHLRELLKRRLPPRQLRRSQVREGERIDWWAGSPYRGLQVFDMAHAAVFFGRERAEREITEALVRRAGTLDGGGKAFVLVLGASGSGKSSLVRAGLLPDVMTPGVVSGVTSWRHAIVHPAELVPDPALGLAAVFARDGALPELAALGYTDEEFAEILRGSPGLLRPPLRAALEKAAAADPLAGAGGVPQARLILVLDQLEVLFTSSVLTAEQRRAFATMISNLAHCGLVWVVATMRSDFFHRLAETPDLNELAAGLGQYQLAHPTAAELDLIICRPAEAAGLAFEEEANDGVSLAATIREAAARDPASLPLLSFLLDELYRRDVERDGGNMLTYASYRTLGMLEGAIARHADELADGLPSELATALDPLLLSLVQVDEISGTTTARLIKQAIIVDPLQQEAADRLIAGRLAVADDPGDGRTLRLAHEALLAYWPRLARLIEEHRDFLIVRRRLQADAANWQRNARDPELLLPPGRRLAEAEDTLARRRADLEPEIVAYVEASTSAEQERQARKRALQQRALQEKLARSRRFAVVVSVFFLLAAAAGLYAWQQREVATAAFEEAEHNYQAAVGQSVGSVRAFVDSYGDGEISNKMMALLIDQAQKTLGSLPRDSDEMLAARTELFDVLSTANWSLGDYEAAERFARTGIAAADALVKKNPTRVQWVRLQASGHGRLSDALRRKGDPAAAADEAKIAIGLCEALLTTRPSDQGVQNDLIDNYERAGLALSTVGRPKEAADYFQRWIRLAEDLASRHPDNAAWRRSLANAHQDLGDALMQQRNYAEAIRSYGISIAGLEKLRAEDPKNMRYLHKHAISQVRLGDVMLAEGRYDDALAEFQAANQLAARLLREEPANFQWHMFLADTHQRLGEALLESGRFDKAEAEFRTYRELITQARERRANTATLFGLSNAYQKMGDVLLAMGDLDSAAAAYLKSLELALDLNRERPARPEWDKNLAMTHHRLGTMLRRQGDTTRARDHFKRCAEVDFNAFAWAPRSRTPPDVTADCRRQASEP
jgi:tetratricopeptide (TPR) repeat protein